MAGSADLIEGFKALEESAAAYRRAAAYYEGDIPEHFANDQIRRLVEGSGHGYRFRLAKIPVNVMANRTRISSVVSTSAGATARIEQIREANDMEIQEAHLHNRMYVYGDAYALVWPIDPEELEEARDGEAVDTPADRALREAGVEITYQSPLSCRAMYDAEDGRRVRYVIRRWKEARPLGEVWRAEVWYVDRLEPWVTEPGASGLDPEQWRPYAEDPDGEEAPIDPGNWPVPHDFGEVPIKHARTGLPYGTPEHADAIGPQDAITKAVVTQVTDVEAHGWPERYRIADDARVLEAGRDAVRWDDDATAPDARPEEVTARRRGAGREHIYTGTKTVGEFTPPDPGALNDPMELWIRMLSTATETPLYEFDPRTAEQMSGVARQWADRPTAAREKDRKRYLLRFWREVWELALRMDGTDPGVITINWEPPEVISDPDWWEVAQVRRAMGVPAARILEEANYLPEEVEEWLEDEGETATLDQQIDRLKALGEALQAVGAGAALLGIEPQIMGIISKILPEAGGKAVPANWEKPTPPPPPEPPVDPEQPPPGEEAP